MVFYPPLQGSETSEARSWVGAKRRGGVISPRGQRSLGRDRHPTPLARRALDPPPPGEGKGGACITLVTPQTPSSAPPGLPPESASNDRCCESSPRRSCRR